MKVNVVIPLKGLLLNGSMSIRNLWLQETETSPHRPKQEEDLLTYAAKEPRNRTASGSAGFRAQVIYSGSGFFHLASLSCTVFFHFQVSLGWPFVLGIFRGPSRSALYPVHSALWRGCSPA